MSDVQTDLYDIDYYAWTQDQAARLRTLAGDNRIDAAHLAEEIEDLGKSELHAVESYVERVLEHFLKIEFSGMADPQKGWRREITGFRMRLRKRLTASMRRWIRDEFEDAYWQACRKAIKSLNNSTFEDRLPPDCPYTLDQVLDPDWFPEPRPSDS
ncbi:MAG: DUF29 family protein [Alphaproteobacteria bacterium]|jgi:phytoene dehydrogenase-like protein|nr:DUF29 family protein [Alphaproteobacteria bacterium]